MIWFDICFPVRCRRSPIGGADPWTPRAGRLSIDERERILKGLAQGGSLSSIARSLGRSPSTIVPMSPVAPFTPTRTVPPSAVE
jgi:hypothetical protein